MTTNKTTTATEGHDLVLTRMIDAPRAKVFKSVDRPRAAQTMVRTKASDDTTRCEILTGRLTS